MRIGMEPVPEDVMQAALSAGELGGTPSEVRAIELAYRAGRADVIMKLCAALTHIEKMPMSFRVSLAKILDVPSPSGSEGDNG